MASVPFRAWGGAWIALRTPSHTPPHTRHPSYDATSYGAPSAGATFAGTAIGFSDFYSGTSSSKSQFYISAARLDGTPVGSDHGA